MNEAPREQITLTINGQGVTTEKGMTVLEAAQAAGIYIPTLCADPDLEPYDGCRLCVVEIEGRPGLPIACTTPASNGMAVHTETPAVSRMRKAIIELFIADHYGDCLAPCKLACPAGIDIQGQLALTAQGQYQEALKLIKASNPLPLVCGHICPRFCEAECRRNLVDEPVAINALKRFVADYDISDAKTYAPEPKPATGHKVAIIGGGPTGLSAAYYLALEGHGVTIFDANPDLGGMLRYGIPEYRLPKAILDKEIATITRLCHEVNLNASWGKDFTLKSLKTGGYEAIFIALGAWADQKLGVEGEDLPGVLSGIGFLNDIARGKKITLGERVAVIGGGNTAIDAARTALRLGAGEVTIVYRRSRKEMPANDEEVEQAEQEGIHIEFLTAPISVAAQDGKVTSMECIRMALGEPDESGRRRPEPIAGSQFTMRVDNVIAAIGQRLNRANFDQDSKLELTRRGYLKVNEATMETSTGGVFAGGDCASGPATAVEAIGAGHRAAISINQYLSGQKVMPEPRRFNSSKGKLDEINASDYEDVARIPRTKMPVLSPEERKRNFTEIELGISETGARREAERCLSCGCLDILECKLREGATNYQVGTTEQCFRGGNKRFTVDKSNPFFILDRNKCILCANCTRTCDEITGVKAILLTYHDYQARVATFGDKPLMDSICQSCGECVVRCPVGALTPKDYPIPLTGEVATTCPYCGVGCGMYLGIRDGRIISVRGDRDNPVSKGRLCVKGRYGINEFVHHPERLTTPLIKRNGEFAEATWDEALDLVAERLARYRGDEVAVISSAKCTNEENYVIQKLARAVLGTNNVDHCARLCHAPTVAGLVKSFGSGAMTNSINEISDAQCILAIGTNTTSAHPIIGFEVKRAVRKGAKLIVANPREINLCRYAELRLGHNPGTDVALLMGMMRVIVDEGLIDSEFITERGENFNVFKESLKSFDLATVEKITGVSQDKIAEAARLYATHKPSTILYAMGITQHSHGTDNVMATANLAMLTGNIGKPSTGVNPLRGQNNVQGACDLGALPNVYPGYQAVTDPKIKAKFEAAWDTSLSPNPGLAITEMIELAGTKLKAVYLMGENPALSEPDAGHAQEALARLEFLVVQDIFLSETAKLADVVLPAASFAEKDGTFTNTERRVQRVRKAVEPPGDSRPDWLITCQIGKRLGGKGFDFESPHEIMEEIASLTPIYGGISYERLESGGLQWPCPTPEHPGTPILHTRQFTRGKGQFIPLEYKPPMELPDDEYPLILTTGRSLFHWHTGTVSRKVAGLNEFMGEGLVEINPEDAKALGITDGEMVKISSRRGEITAKASLTEVSPPGVVFMTFHFAESPTNMLTNPALDPVSKIPEYKVCAVRIDKNGGR